MASQRQVHNRKRQKAILVMAVALLIIVVIAIIGLTTFLKKYSGFQGSYRLQQVLQTGAGGRNVCRFRQ